MELVRPWGRGGRWVVGEAVGGGVGEEEEGGGGGLREGHGRRWGRRVGAKKADGSTNHTRIRLLDYDSSLDHGLVLKRQNKKERQLIVNHILHLTIRVYKPLLHS